VQALGDQCDPADFPATLEEYQQSDPKGKDAGEDEYNAAYRAHCVSHRTPDEVQIVQTYDDNWYVTGVSVREDHGMWVAAAYENPKAPANATYPQPENDLWELSLGLGGSFLNQRDCEKPTAALPVTYDAGNAPATIRPPASAAPTAAGPDRGGS
jgi:hypothetical protein